jgi:hypothetical protein
MPQDKIQRLAAAYPTANVPSVPETFLAPAPMCRVARPGERIEGAPIQETGC